jgi:hypothetical protein
MAQFADMMTLPLAHHNVYLAFIYVIAYLLIFSPLYMI